MEPWSLERCRSEDELDPLGSFRDRVVRNPTGPIYLDGNSLGRLPTETPSIVAQTVVEAWGSGLVQSWNQWMELPFNLGATLATELLGTQPEEVVVSDSTSVNLYKLASAALDARPDRRVMVTDSENFPTDRYILEGLANSRGLELRTINTPVDGAVTMEDLSRVLGDDVALVSFSHVAYRSGALAPMGEINRAAHDVGALTLWDLSHSVGALPIELGASEYDLAVGCTYKYLNGGPGSPAFLCVREALIDELRQPIWGWFSQADQFDMGPTYHPKGGIGKFLVGTPPVIQLEALRGGLSLVIEAGIEALRAKSLLLCDALSALAEEMLVPYGFRLASPKDPSLRGAHLAFEHPNAAELNAYLGDFGGVVTDFRTPNHLRIAPVPLYMGFEELYRGVEIIANVARGWPPRY